MSLLLQMIDSEKLSYMLGKSKILINLNQYRGVKVRVITDDECSKFMGAEIY